MAVRLPCQLDRGWDLSAVTPADLDFFDVGRTAGRGLAGDNCGAQKAARPTLVEASVVGRADPTVADRQRAARQARTRLDKTHSGGWRFSR